MNIGIVIKETRKQKGLTQQDLSDLTNISVRTIQRIENDKVKPTFYSLKSIGEILKVDLLEIKNKNSTMFTTKILGLHLNDLTMKQEETTNLDERLEKIESYLSSIARAHSKQLRIKTLGWIIAGSVFAAFILIEILANLGVFG